MRYPFQRNQPALTMLTLSISLVGSLTLSAQASSKSEIESYLKTFQSNPKAAMKQVPPKYKGSDTLPEHRLKKVKSKFSAESIKSGQFVIERDSWRQKLCGLTGDTDARICLKDVEPGKAPIAGNDLAKNLVDNGDVVSGPLKLVTRMSEIHSKGLRAKTLKSQPWSDTYWPIGAGILGDRYEAEDKPWGTWKAQYDWTQKSGNTLRAIALSGDAAKIDSLSPSEKYDLLIGDLDGTFTRTMWKEGQRYWDQYGEVEGWMGICHGWAPAGFMVDRPETTVKAKAAQSAGGMELTFYPSDIKGLASLSWARAGVDTRFIGGRCNSKDPQVDANGRVTEQDCFDNNPASWHLAMVNQIGVSGRSMVLDATYDYEVWNQPIVEYSYTYFNPKTNQQTEALEAAIVPVEQFTNDKFKAYRTDPRVKSVVGVAMEVTYVVETSASHAMTDTPEEDSLTTTRYMYDLELDAQGNPIGGEWYGNLHPDFLWTPPAGASTALKIESQAYGNWNVDTSGVPAAWLPVARKAATAGLPIWKIVNALVQAAQKQ
ncbi:MAG: hypothetical protein AAB425_04625 [Bdellovibrionota bacterium]